MPIAVGPGVCRCDRAHTAHCDERWVFGVAAVLKCRRACVAVALTEEKDEYYDFFDLSLRDLNADFSLSPTIGKQVRGGTGLFACV
jgi:hypothetical protein